jgi:hypothetical protein
MFFRGVSRERSQRADIISNTRALIGQSPLEFSSPVSNQVVGFRSEILSLETEVTISDLDLGEIHRSVVRIYDFSN